MIVITGMHRSGTSAIAKLLNTIGVPFGSDDNFHQADKWNPRGYYEKEDIIDLNSYILTGFRRCACSRQSAFMSKVLYTTQVKAPGAGLRARKIQTALLSKAGEYQIQAVKDPRFCLTLPYWLWTQKITMCIVCLRDPLESVQSLQRRQNIPLSLGFRFWNRHMASLLRTTHACNTLYIHYNHLLDQTRCERELSHIANALSLKRTRSDWASAYSENFDKGLYHCRGECAARIPSTTQALWEKLEALHREQAA